MTFDEIKQLGGDIVYLYSNYPVNDVWEEITVSQVKELLAEAEEIMREIERKPVFDKQRYERAKLRKMDIDSAFRVADPNSRWFRAVHPQTQREFFAVAKA